MVGKNLDKTIIYCLVLYKSVGRPVFIGCRYSCPRNTGVCCGISCQRDIYACLYDSHFSRYRRDKRGAISHVAQIGSWLRVALVSVFSSYRSVYHTSYR
jgi:hypothetical protein